MCELRFYLLVDFVSSDDQFILRSFERLQDLHHTTCYATTPLAMPPHHSLCHYAAFYKLPHLQQIVIDGLESFMLPRDDCE